MMEYADTFKPGITIHDLDKGDYIYIVKIWKGYEVILECRFARYYHSVYAVCVNCEPHWYNAQFQGKIVTARRARCFLWGTGGFDTEPRCHWFDQGD